MKILQFLKDGEGSFSSTRLVMVSWYGTVGIIWAWISVKAMMLQPIPESVLILLGISTAGKLGQNVTEQGGGK